MQLSCELNCSLSSYEGVQDMPLQNMLLGHIDYFELKVLETRQMPEGHSDHPYSF